jgi:uncharacterized protein (DUF2384 family)
MARPNKLADTAQAKTRRASAKAKGQSPSARALRGAALAAAFIGEEGVDFGRILDRFGMSKAQLAETVGLKPETLHRGSRAKAPRTQSRVTEMLEIIGRVADWAGGERQAMAWYRAEPIPAFGDRTAESLVKEGKAAAVRDYLDHLALGGYA